MTRTARSTQILTLLPVALTPMRRLPLELSVLAALLVSFLIVPLPLPHVAAAMAWAALTALHVARRRRIYTALLRSRRGCRVAATTALIACAAVVTVSGFAQWAGVAAATPWHAGSSTLLIVLAATHATHRLWRMRRRPVAHGHGRKFRGGLAVAPRPSFAQRDQSRTYCGEDRSRYGPIR